MSVLREFIAATRGYPSRAFFICLGAYVFSQLDLALFAYAVPSIRQDFGISLPAMGLIIAGSYTLGGIIQVWFGHLTDRLGRKTMLQASTVASSLCVAAHSIAPNPLALTLARGAAIATGGAMYPVTGAVVTEEAPARFRGIMGGLLQTGYPIGWFAASLFAAPLLTAFGWRALFLVGLLSIPYVIVIRLWLKESARFAAVKAEKANAGLRASIGELFTPAMRRRTATLFAAQFLFVVAYGGASLFFPTYLVEDRGLQIGSSAYLVGIGNGVGAFGYVLAAVAGEFWLTRRTTVVVWTLLGAAAFMVLIWGTTGYADTVIVFAVMSMFFYGTAAVKFVYVAEVFPTRLRATGLAVCGSLAVNLGIAIGPLTMSWMVQHIGWDYTFSLFVALPLALAGLLYLRLAPVPSGLDVDEVARRMAAD